SSLFGNRIRSRVDARALAPAGVSARVSFLEIIDSSPNNLVFELFRNSTVDGSAKWSRPDVLRFRPPSAPSQLGGLLARYLATQHGDSRAAIESENQSGLRRAEGPRSVVLPGRCCTHRSSPPGGCQVI